MPALAPGNFSKPMGKKRELSLHSIGLRNQNSLDLATERFSARDAEQRILIYRINSRDIILTLKGTALDIHACANTNHTVLSKYSELSNTSSHSPRANTHRQNCSNNFHVDLVKLVLFVIVHVDQASECSLNLYSD